jgi:hypothetical protein
MGAGLKEFYCIYGTTKWKKQLIYARYGEVISIINGNIKIRINIQEIFPFLFCLCNL